jgi:hypothetical protein
MRFEQIHLEKSNLAEAENSVSLRAHCTGVSVVNEKKLHLYIKRK